MQLTTVISLNTTQCDKGGFSSTGLHSLSCGINNILEQPTTAAAEIDKPN